MNIKDLSTQLLYTTVPIYGLKSDGSQVSGTVFIFSFINEQNNSKTIPFLITNYHVLDGVSQGFIEFSLSKNNLPVKGKSIRIHFDHTIIHNNKLGPLDLIAIPLAEAINKLDSENKNIFYRTIDANLIPKNDTIEKLAALEDIIFIGYPSGLYDNHNKSSIIRQGITATPIWNDFEGKPNFLIDAGVFPGSSGSPVFIFNQGSYPTNDGITIGSRILFVGILTETIVRQENTFLNLGLVINSKAMFSELEKLVKRLLNKEP